MVKWTQSASRLCTAGCAFLHLYANWSMQLKPQISNQTWALVWAASPGALTLWINIIPHIKSKPNQSLNLFSTQALLTRTRIVNVMGWNRGAASLLRSAPHTTTSDRTPLHRTTQRHLQHLMAFKGREVRFIENERPCLLDRTAMWHLEVIMFIAAVQTNAPGTERVVYGFFFFFSQRIKKCVSSNHGHKSSQGVCETRQLFLRHWGHPEHREREEH